MFTSELWNSGASVYSIGQSIRFNKADSAFISRTPSGAGNRRTFTLSWWWKFGLIGSLNGNAHQLWNSFQDNNNRFSIMIDNDVGSGGAGDKFCIFDSNGGTFIEILETNRLFRDVSAWYHFVVVVDTTQSTASDRVRLYVNGVRETSFAEGTMPSLNYETNWNTANLHLFGKYGGGTGNPCDGYMAECHHIDGTALDPSSFGETNDNGIWIPKKYSGSYGTNGFFIDGRDASDLGDDESGNGNDFTTSGLTSADQMADTPTNNHAIMNVIDHRNPTNWTISNGNLDVRWQGNAAPNSLFSTLSMPATGKWYFEFEFDADGSGNVLTNQNMRIGLMREDTNAAFVEANSTVDLTTSSTSPEILVVLGNSGNANQVKGMGSTINNATGTMSAGDRINFARNGANLWIGKNGTYYNSGNPATGSNPTLSNLQLQGYRANMHWTTGSTSANCIVKAYFGGDKSIGSGTGFNDTVPSGFLALNTTNLGS